MTLDFFKESVKNYGWIITRKGGYIYFKRRDKSKVYNQGDIYSCHTKDIQKAMQIIQNWILTGFPLTKKEKIQELTVIDFLNSVWSENSAYCRTAEIEGRHFTKYYLKRSREVVAMYAEPYFKKMKLSELNESVLNGFFEKLYHYKSRYTGNVLARGTIIKIKSAIIVPMRWGRRKGIIKQSIDFSIVAPNLCRKPARNRGILTPEETAILLSHKWEDKKAYIAFCIAINCGLRIGEIRALKIGNIKQNYLIVTNSFNDVDGLKCTKNGKSRIVPCSDSLLKIIADYILTLPPDEQNADCFLLTDDFKSNVPLNKNYCLKGFYNAMAQCGIKRKRKNPLTGENEYICFHSLRHQTATRWVESGLDLRLIAQAMGHTVKMLEHYSNHLDNDAMQILRMGLEQKQLLGALTTEKKDNTL